MMSAVEKNDLLNEGGMITPFQFIFGRACIKGISWVNLVGNELHLEDLFQITFF